jgi:hypothetical protein
MITSTVNYGVLLCKSAGFERLSLLLITGGGYVVRFSLHGIPSLADGP